MGLWHWPHNCNAIHTGLYNRVETQPGLDQYVGKPAELQSEAIEPLLQWARAVIPAQHQKQTPLFLLGTGGLRRLPVNKQQQLMVDVRSILAGARFRCAVQCMHASVLLQ